MLSNNNNLSEPGVSNSKAPESSSRTRLEMVDALRGFALMGLFIVHMVEYFELYWFSTEPGWVHDVVFLVFGGKAHLIFALLFGLSFHIMMSRQAARGVDFRGRFAWRLVLLLALGYLHSLIYGGDILQVLSLCGLLLVLAYPLSNRWIFVISLVFLLQLPALIRALYFTNLGEPLGNPLFWAPMGENLKMYANAGFWELTNYNSWSGQKGKWVFWLETGRLWNVIGLFLWGVLLGRVQFFEKIASYQRQCWIALAVVIAVLTGLYMVAPWLESTAPEITRRLFVEVIGNYKNVLSTGLIVLLFIFLYRVLRLSPLLNLNVMAGRMSLTLYLGQSFICVPLFYGYGLAWHQSIGQVNALMLSGVFWAAQVLFAVLWFKVFLYGPFEWAWRSLTALKRDIPILKSKR